MSKENMENPMLVTRVITAMNRLIDAKETSPASFLHEKALMKVAGMAANESGAAEIMSRLQEG